LLSHQNFGCSAGTTPALPSFCAPPPVFSKSNSATNAAANEMVGIMEDLMTPSKPERSAATGSGGSGGGGGGDDDVAEGLPVRALTA
jgi:hypothetical protein